MQDIPKDQNYVIAAIEKLSITDIANGCDVAPSAVHRWKKNGRLPRTDLTGETSYAEVINKLSNGEYSVSRLHDQTRNVLSHMLNNHSNYKAC